MALGGCSTPGSAGTMATMLPTSTPPSSLPGSPAPGLAEQFQQVNIVVAVRIARRAAAFGVAEPGVETRRLERVGVQGHPVTATAHDLGFSRSQQPGPQARTALIVAHPEQVDVTAPAPRPPVEPCEQVTVVPADGHAQHLAIMVTGDGCIEGADLLVKPFGEASVGVADSEPDLTHDRSPSTDGRSGLLDQDGTGVEQIEALTLRVLLGFRSWLGGDDGHVAASGGSVGEPGGQQRGLHTPAAVRRDGCRAGELRDALGYPHGGAADDDPVA